MPGPGQDQALGQGQRRMQQPAKDILSGGAQFLDRETAHHLAGQHGDGVTVFEPTPVDGVWEQKL